MDFEKIQNDLATSKVVTGKKYVGIALNTIKAYMNKIKFLNEKEALNSTLLEFLNANYENINSRNAYEIAILGVCKHSEYFKEHLGNDIFQIISDDNDNLNKDAQKNRPKQFKTENQNVNWIDYKDLVKLYKEKKDEFNIQDQLLIAMYILMPPLRLDLHNVTIIRGLFVDENTKLPKGINENDNYIQIYKKSGRPYSDMTINEFKTSKKYGIWKNRLPKPITDIIMKLPIDQTHLFMAKTGGPFASEDTFGPYLKRVFKKLTNKNISVDLLRHIYITHARRGEISQDKKEQLAKLMCNSVFEQDNYICKQNIDDDIIN